jgi:D-inositol-3-phosphate glycosyltransferase
LLPRILFIGHAGIPTGFARVTESILRELSAAFECHHLGISLHQAPAAADSRWRVHPNPAGLHSASGLRRLLESIQPDLIVVVDEPWVAVRLAPALSGLGNGRSIFYGAVDSPASVGPHVAAALAQFDCFVAFTGFGRRLAASSLRTNGGRLPRLETIPHGVDEAFHPLDPSDFRASRRLARRELFPDRPDLQDSFIVLNANRNQPVKRIDLFLRGFAIFAANKGPEVKLYLHMGSRPAQPGETPLTVALGLSDRLVSPRYDFHPELSDSRLNLVYNACDIGVNASAREGWGLVSFEHAATGAAQIVPRHSACAELWANDAALLFEGGPEGVAEALETMWRDTSRREAVALAGYRNAHREEYTWRAVAQRWSGLFREMLP